MAIAPEALDAGAAVAAVSARLGRHAKDVKRVAPKLLPTAVSGRSSILPRLITAAFLGLLALEVVSQVTGRYFGYSLQTPLKPKGDQTYRPLYQGQQLDASATSAFPQGPADRNSAQTVTAAIPANAAGAGMDTLVRP